jgi:hypothetical protein
VFQDGQSEFGAVLGLGLGLYFFWKGFRELKLKKLIDGIATSKVRSLAMGTVELFGRTESFQDLVDPVYELACVYYEVEAKEQRGSGKNSSWVTIYRNRSPFPFYLADETGRIPVLPAGAKLYMDRDLDFTTNAVDRFFAASAADPVQRFVSRLSCASGATVRIEATILREQEPLYVLGYAAPSLTPLTLGERISGAARQAAASLLELARQLKADPARMKALDKNKDGTVDAQEWDEGLKAYRAEMDQKAQVEALAPLPPEEIVVRKSPEGLLILSDKSEKDIVKSLGRRAFLEILGGPALVLWCAAYLGRHLGLF